MNVQLNISHIRNPFPTPLMSAAKETATGVLIVKVNLNANLLSRDSMSTASDNSTVLSGTYGDYTSCPTIESATAYNSGGAAGLNNLDSIIVSFTTSPKPQQVHSDI